LLVAYIGKKSCLIFKILVLNNKHFILNVTLLLLIWEGFIFNCSCPIWCSLHFRVLKPHISARTMFRCGIHVASVGVWLLWISQNPL